jgi:hypothetical protein
MMRQFTAFAGSLIMATALVAAQGDQKPPQPTPNPQPPAAPQTPAAPARQTTPEVSLTGCLTQGTSPTVFILDNAKLSSAEKTEKGKTYVLASGTENLNFKAHLNHEVTITGMAESKVSAAPTPGQKVDEKDLPTLTAKSLTMMADRCVTSH